MNKAVAWNTTEPDDDLQAAARRAARREGMSIGEWLDFVVERKAADLGIAAEDLDSNQRVSAVTERLKSMSGAPLARGGARTAAMAGSEARDRRGPPSSRYRDGAPSAYRPPSRLAEAPALDRRQLETSTSTLPPRWRDLKTFGKTEDRAAIDAGRKPRPATDDVDDLRQIEAKLKTLFRTLDRKGEAGDDAERASDLPRGSARLGESRKSTAPAAAKAASAVVQPGRRKTLAEAIAEIQGRQAVLDGPAKGEVPSAKAEAKGRKAPVDIESRAAASELLDQFSSFGRTRAAARPKPQAEVESAEVSSLRHDIAALSRSVGELAPKDSVKSLEAAVRDLGAAMEAARDGGLRDMILAPVERLARDLRASVKELDSKQAVSDLDREIRALGDKIESVTIRGVDADSLKRIQEQTTEVRDLLATAASRPLPMDRVERHLADLDARVDRIGGGAPRSDQAVATALDEVRAALNGFKDHQGVETLERRVEALAAKIDSAIAGQVRPSVIDALAKRIENVQASLETRAGPQAPSSVDLAPLERMISGLIGRVDGLQDHQRDLHGLEDMVHRLATRLETIRDPGANSEVFTALQRQIGQLTTRMDRSDAGLQAIVSVERSLGDLFAQLEQTRDATISAAEGAARTAARDTLRAAMLDRDRMGPRSDDGMAVEVSHELAEFRSSREAADQRLGVMLSTVTETLEHVMARLATLETGPSRSVDRDQDAFEAESRAPQPARAPAKQPSAPDKRRPDRRTEVMDLGEADFPIEPGFAAARPRAPKIQASAPDLRADPSQFIAAARRAAQAAAEDTATRAATAKRERTAAAEPVPDEADGATMMVRAKSAVAAKRRPLLLGLAGLILLLGAVQVARLSLSDPEPQPAAGSAATMGSAGDHDTAAPLSPLTSLQAKSSIEAPQAPDAASVPSQPAASALPAPPANDSAAAAPSAPAPARSLPTLAMAPAMARAAQHAAAAQAEASGGIGQGLRDLAQGGQPAAQYEMAVRLTDGRGATRDLQAAASWFQKAADQGLVPAEYRLGSLYEKGIGVAKDPARSVEWYQKAAEAGNARAMHNLAVMLAEGAGGKSDYSKAAQWFSKASQMGVRDSQFNLAILYARGLGIEQSMVESYKWFAVAAAQGDEDAAKKRDEVAARLDPKALAAAKQAADDFKPITPLKAANEVQPPPGGWDAVAPSRGGQTSDGGGKTNGRTNT